MNLTRKKARLVTEGSVDPIAVKLKRAKRRERARLKRLPEAVRKEREKQLKRDEKRKLEALREVEREIEREKARKRMAERKREEDRMFQFAVEPCDHQPRRCDCSICWQYCELCGRLGCAGVHCS